MLRFRRFLRVKLDVRQIAGVKDMTNIMSVKATYRKVFLPDCRVLPQFRSISTLFEVFKEIAHHQSVWIVQS